MAVRIGLISVALLGALACATPRSEGVAVACGPIESRHFVRTGETARGTYTAVYSAESVLEQIRWDTNGDGQADVWETYAGQAYPQRADIDTNADGTPDDLVEYGAMGRPIHFMRDSNGDGTLDQELRPANARPAEPFPIPFSAKFERCDSPECQRFLMRLQRAVYAQWSPHEYPSAAVSIQFRVDERGCPHAVRVLNSDPPAAAESCLAAIQDVHPPALPPELTFLIGKDIYAHFKVGDVGSR